MAAFQSDFRSAVLARVTYEVWVEVCSARHLDVLEEMFVSLCWDGRTEREDIVVVADAHPNIRMWRAWRNRKKEGLLVGCRDRLVKKTIRFVGEDIGHILALVTLWFLPVALERTVQVVVRERIKQEVLARLVPFLIM